MVGGNRLLHHLAGALRCIFLGLDIRKLPLELRNPAIGQLTGALEFAAPLGVGEIDTQAVEFSLQFLGVGELVLLRAPARGQRRRFLLKLGQLLLERLETGLGAEVAFLLERFLLDLEPDDLAVERIQLFRLGIDLHLQPRGRLVHEVDGLVREEAVGDVAVGQRRRRHECGIGDPHTMVLLVFVLQPAQDRDRILDRGLADEDRLEAPRQCRILLDMLAILVKRGRADAMQLAARKRGLEQVRCVHRAIALARANQRVHLVNEQDEIAVARGHLLKHGLQPLLELAAIFRAGDQRTEVQRQQLLVLQALRHIAIDNAQRQALGDGGFADAGLADQNGIVLGPARQHLDRTADLLVAADDRIELAVARRLGQVARIFLQRVIGVLGGRGIRGPALAQRLDRRIEVLRSDAALGEDRAGLAGLLQREAKQQPLDGDKAVAGLLAGLFGGVEGAARAQAPDRSGRRRRQRPSAPC
ncbi:hypothetical protein ACVW0I_007733 [Bradyrhizobium sp. LM6.11]